MGSRHFKPWQTIHMLREAQISLAGGQATAEVYRKLKISEQTGCR